MIKKESEAWDAIADTLEMLEGMPPFKTGGNAEGLCTVLFMMSIDFIIHTSLKSRMDERIRTKTKPGRSYLCISGQWRPRVKWARRFAEEARREGK